MGCLLASCDSRSLPVGAGRMRTEWWLGRVRTASAVIRIWGHSSRPLGGLPGGTLVGVREVEPERIDSWSV